MSARRCWTSSRPWPAARRAASGERLDRPAQLAQFAALVVALRAVRPPLDDVGVEEVPVADRTDSGADVRARADQALGLQDAQGLADDGAGDLEALADLLGDERAVGAEIAGDDHLAELLDELTVEATASTAGGAAADPAHLGLAVPHGRHAVGALCTDGVGVGVAVKLARTGEAGVGGASRGHHGVRKGTHVSFVGDVPERLKVFGEKHTKV